MFGSAVQKMKFPIKDFFSKCDQIRKKLFFCPHLLKKSLMENFIFCAVQDSKCTSGFRVSLHVVFWPNTFLNIGIFFINDFHLFDSDFFRHFSTEKQ